jgi:hypothetical protein
MPTHDAPAPGAGAHVLDQHRAVDGRLAFLKTYEVDHILAMTHLAVAELRSRGANTTINIASPAQLTYSSS